MSKKKKRGKKKKGKSDKMIKSEAPTEKDLLQAKIKDLSTELADIEKNLEKQEQILHSVKELRNQELKIKESCVAHLKRILRTKADQCLAVQNELQFVKDMKELAENRASDAKQNLEKTRENAGSLFSQQRSELAGQLSALEERRLKKNSQWTYLKRIEKDLEEKLAINKKEEIEEDRVRVSELLEKKKTFEKMVDNLCAESKEVFKLTLPVYAKKQLHDDVRLRRLCDEMSENILDEQDRRRRLEKLKKVLDVEKQTQIYTEELLKSQIQKLDSELKFLLESEVKLRFVDLSSDDDDLLAKKVAIHKKIEELHKAEDERTDVLMISKDQEDYKQELEKQLAKRIEQNGSMMSAILRAGKIVHSRMEEVGEISEYDFEFLKQIRMLLEDFL